MVTSREPSFPRSKSRVEFQDLCWADITGRKADGEIVRLATSKQSANAHKRRQRREASGATTLGRLIVDLARRHRARLRETDSGRDTAEEINDRQNVGGDLRGASIRLGSDSARRASSQTWTRRHPVSRWTVGHFTNLGSTSRFPLESSARLVASLQTNPNDDMPPPLLSQ